MISRTKRWLAVLALALGLIAAAPYVFYAVVDREAEIVPKAGFRLALIGERHAETNFRHLQLWIGPLSVAYMTNSSLLVTSLYVFGTGPGFDGYYDFPHESITLRVACAVALTGVSWLVLFGRMLARRWVGNAAA